MQLFVHVPNFIKKLYPKRTWNIPTRAKKIYLTFDDGPIPEITTWVMQQLDAYQAKATFFCIGNNIEKHPELFQQLKSSGNAVGNHTYNHLNGWNTSTKTYQKNTEKAETFIDSNLFRPPYGKLKSKQAKILLKKGYQIIMWDVLSEDYNKNRTPEACLQNVLKHTTSGSIVIFHDSLKAEKNLRYVLPKVLAHFKKQGYSFEALPVTHIV